MTRFIIRAPDAFKANEALRFAINLIESDHQQCAYQAGGSGNRYYAERTVTGVSCRFLPKDPQP